MAIEPRAIGSLGDEELLTRLSVLVARSNATEADLLEVLAEVDDRQLYLPRRTSMWDYCLRDLGFSENSAGNRIAVARESRRFPRMLEMLRDGRIHLSGLRLLCGHLADGGDALLDAAVGKTKREIEELLAHRFPKPAVPDQIRKLPQRAAPAPAPAETTLPLASSAMEPTSAPLPIAPRAGAAITPLSAEAYQLKATMSPAQRGRLRELQDLLRHRIPSGDIAQVLDLAVTTLIGQIKKERFGIGKKPRPRKTRPEGQAETRHVPVALRRQVYERDGGQCTYVDPEGRRCEARGFLEIDHTDGFARTREHRADTLRLLCKPHNQHAADRLYGKGFMDGRRRQSARCDDRDLPREQ